VTVAGYLRAIKKAPPRILVTRTTLRPPPQDDNRGVFSIRPPNPRLYACPGLYLATGPGGRSLPRLRVGAGFWPLPGRNLVSVLDPWPVAPTPPHPVSPVHAMTDVLSALSKPHPRAGESARVQTHVGQLLFSLARPMPSLHVPPWARLVAPVGGTRS